MAMQTIGNASEGVSGRATELLPLSSSPTELPVNRCPIDLTGRLAGKNFCWYRGYYHTDHTLPRVYFRDDIERPSDITAIEPLDFTYLFNDSADNPAFRTMGSGVPIRSDERTLETPAYKRDRVEPSEINISSERALAAALRRD